MADWFSEMVAQLSDEVIASPQTATRLLMSDRVTAGDLKAALVTSEDELRAQFADNVKAVQEIRDNTALAERSVLAREWLAVRAAVRRLQEAREGTAVTPNRLVRLIRRLPLISRFTHDDSDVAKALRNVEAIQNAYQRARAARRVDQLEPIRIFNTDRDDQLIVLGDLLRQALVLKVNEVIDDVLEASYEREFSYAEPAILTDPLGTPSVQSVNAGAYQQIKYFLDKVGSGTIGVAGPRGSGKSTLLSQFASTVKIHDEPRQWGVCVPAPTKYDSRDFLLYLFAQLCFEVLGPTRARAVESRLTMTRPAASSIRPAARILALVAVMALACSAVVIGLRTARLGESPDRMADLEIASCAAAVFLIAGVTALFDTLLVVALSTLFLVAQFVFPAYRRSTRYLSVVLRSTVVVSGVTTATLFGLFLAGYTLDPGYLAAAGLGLASATGLVVMILTLLPGRIERDTPALRISLHPERAYISEAEEWYAKVKFQQSFTTGWSGTVTVGAPSLPVQAQGGSSGSTAVIPLAMSTPEIVAAIKSFTQSLAGPRRDDEPEVRTPVVIGIDEVDKIEDPQEAQAFLNQIKGLFGDISSLFLVSISDDAMAAFERRGMPFRDAFDSSLSSVVTLSYLSRKEARTLTGSRLVGVQEPVADLLFVLSGGLARDLVRLIRRAVEAREERSTKLDELALALIAAEVEAKKRAVLARARTMEPCPAKDDLLAWAGRRRTEVTESGAYFAELLEQAAALIGAACDGTAHDQGPDLAGCVSMEMGVFGFWLVTVGQVFAKCSGREDFLEGESPDGDKSFERLAEARQSFPLGAGYVLAATTAIRKTWDLTDGLPARSRPRPPRSVAPPRPARLAQSSRPRRPSRTPGPRPNDVGRPLSTPQ